MHRRNQNKPFTLSEKSWILYDIGNSAFILIIATTFMPIFFKDVVSEGISNTVSTSNWALAISLSSIVLAVIAPLLGTLADYQNLKKRFFFIFLMIGLFSTLLLTTVGKGDWLLCLIIFGAAKIGFSGSNIFYDSFIVDITTNKRMNLVSAAGYGWGYIGSTIPFVLSLVIFYLLGNEAISLPVLPMKIIFMLTAMWWFGFSIPILKNVSQTFYKKKVIRCCVIHLSSYGKHLRRSEAIKIFIYF